MDQVLTVTSDKVIRLQSTFQSDLKSFSDAKIVFHQVQKRMWASLRALQVSLGRFARREGPVIVVVETETYTIYPNGYVKHNQKLM